LAGKASTVTTPSSPYFEYNAATATTTADCFGSEANASKPADWLQKSVSYFRTISFTYRTRPPPCPPGIANNKINPHCSWITKKRHGMGRLIWDLDAAGTTRFSLCEYQKTSFPPCARPGVGQHFGRLRVCTMLLVRRCVVYRCKTMPGVLYGADLLSPSLALMTCSSTGNQKGRFLPTTR
jgi:hypothetical protein